MPSSVLRIASENLQHLSRRDERTPEVLSLACTMATSLLLLVRISNLDPAVDFCQL